MSHYNPCRSQILTPQRYLFVTMPENATNGHGGRNKTLRNSELPTTHAKKSGYGKDCAVPLRFAYRHRTLHQLILKPKIKDNEEYIFSNLLPQASGSEKGRDSSVMGRITVDGSQTQFSCKLTVDPEIVGHQRWTCHGQKHGGTRNEPYA